jgi:hypothetical protein
MLKRARVASEAALDSWRTRLEAATQERAPARISRPSGAWRDGSLVRSEPGGLVVNVPDHDLRSGEDVRLRFEWDGAAVHLAATVARAGVPVPDRGPSGLRLGLIRPLASSDPPRTTTPDRAPAAAPLLALRVSGDRQVSLLAEPVRVIELAPRRVVFEVPRSWTLVFPAQGTLWLRIGEDRASPVEAQGRIHSVASGDALVAYTVELEEVEDRDRHERAMAAVAAHLRLW